MPKVPRAMSLLCGLAALPLVGCGSLRSTLADLGEINSTFADESSARERFQSFVDEDTVGVRVEVVRALEDDDPSVRAGAATAVGIYGVDWYLVEAGEAALVQDLSPALTDSAWQVRLRGAWALSQLLPAEPRHVFSPLAGRLKPLLDDPEESVRVSAASCLVSLANGDTLGMVLGRLGPSRLDSLLVAAHGGTPQKTLASQAWVWAHFGGRFSDDPDGFTELRSVGRKSPAAAVGLSAGDVIHRLGGEDLVNAREFADDLLRMGPGARVTLVFTRDGKEREAVLRLSDEPEDW